MKNTIAIVLAAGLAALVLAAPAEPEVQREKKSPGAPVIGSSHLQVPIHNQHHQVYPQHGHIGKPHHRDSEGEQEVDQASGGMKEAEDMSERAASAARSYGGYGGLVSAGGYAPAAVAVAPAHYGGAPLALSAGGCGGYSGLNLHGLNLAGYTGAGLKGSYSGYSGPSVGVFPASVNTGSLPLLFSCSPNLQSGALLRQPCHQASYGHPAAAYGHASSYRQNEGAEEQQPGQQGEQQDALQQQQAMMRSALEQQAAIIQHAAWQQKAAEQQAQQGQQVSAGQANPSQLTQQPASYYASFPGQEGLYKFL